MRFNSVKNKSSGFTIVELIVVVLVVAVLVLVTSRIPLFTSGFWRQGTDRLSMQRDANYAMIYIQRRLKPASFTVAPQVPYYAEGTTYYSLTIGDVTFEVDGGNHDLVEKNGAGVITGTVISGEDGTEFSVERDGIAINMTLTLVRESGQTTHRTAVKPRN